MQFSYPQERTSLNLYNQLPDFLKLSIKYEAKSKKKSSKKEVYVVVSSYGYWDTNKRTFICDRCVIGDSIIGTPGIPLTLEDVSLAIRSYYEIMEDEGKEPIFQFYFGDFEFNQWIRSNDEFINKQLADRKSRIMSDSKKPKKRGGQKTRDVYEEKDYTLGYEHTKRVYVEFGSAANRFRFDYISGVYFIIEWNNRRSENRDLISSGVFDAGTIFNQPQEKTIKSLLKGQLNEEEIDVIENGRKFTGEIWCTKEERETNIAEIDRNARIEASLLSRAFTVFYNSLKVIFDGEMETALKGPGSIANTLISMVRNRVLNEDGQPALLNANETANLLGPRRAKIANNSFYGGRSETFIHGRYEGLVTCRDMNSAYPYQISKLKSLRNATIVDSTDSEFLKKEVEKENYVFVEVSYEGSNPFMGGPNYRTLGEGGKEYILNPMNGTVSMMFSELLAHVRAGTVDSYTIHSGFSIQLDNTQPRPMKIVEDIYEERLKIGKNEPTGIAFKIVLNSIFGKLAQSKLPYRYANMVYASIITSKAREALLDAVASHPRGIEAVAAMETDAIYFLGEHPYLPVEPRKFGAWDETRYEDGMAFIRSGIHYALNPKEDKDNWYANQEVKTKGYKKDSFKSVLPEIDRKLRKMAEKKEWNYFDYVEMEDRMQLMTLGQAYQRDRLSEVGDFVLSNKDLPEEQREMNFNIHGSRENLVYDDSIGCFRSHCPLFPMSDEMISPFGEAPMAVKKMKVIGGLNLDRYRETSEEDYKDFDEQLADADKKVS